MIDQDYFILLGLAFIAWWVLGAFAVMYAAQKRGYNSGNWLITGLFFGPLLASLFLIANPEKAPSTESTAAPTA